jgi:hypothetical protein
VIGREEARLEAEARRIIEQARGEVGLHASVARELALALDSLDRVRSLHQWQEDMLVQDECKVGTELLRIETLYAPHSRLATIQRARLLALAAERRALTAKFAAQLATYHQRLFDLVQRYRLLEP